VLYKLVFTAQCYTGHGIATVHDIEVSWSHRLE